jgi:hypothetical protein
VTTDDAGTTELADLKGFETIRLADVATWGGESVVAFTALREGQSFVGCIELPERRTTVLGEFPDVDRVVVERRLQPDPAPWSVLVEQHGAVISHSLGGHA